MLLSQSKLYTYREVPFLMSSTSKSTPTVGDFEVLGYYWISLYGAPQSSFNYTRAQIDCIFTAPSKYNTKIRVPLVSVYFRKYNKEFSEMSPFYRDSDLAQKIQSHSKLHYNISETDSRAKNNTKYLWKIQFRNI